MPNWYSHSADIPCLSIRALRLSGKEALANSGSFLSPGATGGNHVGWSCVWEKSGPSTEVWPLSSALSPPASPRVSHTHTWKSRGCQLHWAAEFSVTRHHSGRNSGVWFTHSSNFAQLMFCNILRRERREWNLNRCQCFITAFPKIWIKVDWLSAPTSPHGTFSGFCSSHSLRSHWISVLQNTKPFHRHQFIWALHIDENGKAYMINQYPFPGGTFFQLECDNFIHWFLVMLL